MEFVNKNKPFNTDGVFVYSCQYHIIICPKYRRKILIDEVELRLKSLIFEKQEEYKYTVLDIEVMPDHLHLLLDVNPRRGIYKIVTAIKGFTSRILRSEFSSLKSKLPTLWTRSRFISSVGAVTLDTVKKYIEEQKRK